MYYYGNYIIKLTESWKALVIKFSKLYTNP